MKKNAYSFAMFKKTVNMNAAKRFARGPDAAIQASAVYESFFV
jgi:hypothetical protein